MFFRSQEFYDNCSFIMDSKSLNSEYLVLGHVYKIRLKDNNGQKGTLQFADSSEYDSIDNIIRGIFGIKQNQLYAVSYVEKDTCKNIHVMTNGEHFSECVMMGIEMLNVNIHPPEPQLPSGKLYTRIIFAIRCQLFEKYLFSAI